MSIARISFVFGLALSSGICFPIMQQDDSFGVNASQIGSNIRQEIAQDRPQVNINRNTGASSSSSLTNNVLVNKGRNPSIKNGQALAVDIAIRGPLETTNNQFANTAMFGTDDNDFGTAQANGGRASNGKTGTMTGTNVHLVNNKPGSPSFASSFNKANTNNFSSGNGRGTNGFFGQAAATGDVQRR